MYKGDLLKILKEYNLISSNSDGLRLIKGGAIRFGQSPPWKDWETIEDANWTNCNLCGVLKIGNRGWIKIITPYKAYIWISP